MVTILERAGGNCGLEASEGDLRQVLWSDQLVCHENHPAPALR
jgi:hypothetical protein